jgi:hypothetical protein
MTSIVAQPRRGCALILLLCVALACRSLPQPRASGPHYLVTQNTIDVGEGIGLCIAVDPVDPRGVWWWMPGASGCSSRSSGPGLVHAEQATVTRATPAAPTALSFRLGTRSATRPCIDVRLIVEDGRMRALETGAQVSMKTRGNLEVPEIPRLEGDDGPANMPLQPTSVARATR